MELTGGPKIQSRPKMRLENVTYRIGEKDILQGVSGAVHTNRLTGLIGPNGAGKSTLLRLLGGLRHPSAGRIVLEERDLATFSALERARCLAMVPQNPAVGFGFTVEQVVAMGRHPFLRRLQPLTPHCRSVIDEAMASTRVEHLRSRMLTELSGGEQQRVFLARALAQEPKILLLDEPTANLDVRFQLELFALIDRLQRERPLTVVVALHDLTMALRYCDQVIVLHEGCMRAEGAPERVITPALVEAVFGVRAGKVDGAFGPLVDLNPL